MIPKTLGVLLLAASLSAGTAPAASTNSPLNVLQGPAKATLKNIARLDVPAGYVFLDGDSTRKLLKMSGEPVSGGELGMLSPTNDEWTVMFEFDDVGYVKDDEKDKLDAGKMLAAIKAGTEEANKERAKNGIPPILVVGWEQPPTYNPETHNLEWAVRATSDGHPILNYNTRLLGRKGVMELVLIVEPDKLAATLPDYKKILAHYSFQSGQSYAEFKPGDKIAAYGLTALVVGGAALGAAKLGLFASLAILLKKAWKLVVVAIVAVASFFRKIFARLTGRSTDDRTT
ncbi:MAG: DUF2167 domain-containing protein [Verrucomicrobiota bacterium]